MLSQKLPIVMRNKLINVSRHTSLLNIRKCQISLKYYSYAILGKWLVCLISLGEIGVI